MANELAICHCSICRFNENITSSFRMYKESQGPDSEDRKAISGMYVKASQSSKDCLVNPRARPITLRG